MSGLSIRWRLTLWYGAVLAGVLGIFGTSVFLSMRRGLQNRTSRSLANQMIVIEDELARTKPEVLHSRLKAHYSRHPAFDLQVTGADGSILLRSERILERGLPAPSLPSTKGGGVFEDIRTDDQDRSRMFSRTIASGGAPLLVQVATSLSQNDVQLADLLSMLLLTIPLAVGSTLGGGYLLARKALAPVDRMAATAEEITATRLDRRLEAPNPDDELGRLARALNCMIARLEESFQQVRRFTADAAHELRTPLAILRNEAEVALRVPRESEQYRTSLEDMLEEIEHLSRLSEDLLLLFREDAGLSAQPREPVRLDRLAREMAEDLRVVATEHDQSLVLEPPTPCRVMGNPEQLRRLLFNLLDNAIHFTPAGGTIAIEVECDKNQARLVVSDSGIGIAPEHLPRIFDRFYRGDSSRSRRTGGSGLGLSICKSIAEAHRGSIEIESEPGKGTRVSLTLPAAAIDPGRESKPGSLITQEA
jgi:two-component system heavy metal sensor histidine kinase CusS